MVEGVRRQFQRRRRAIQAVRITASCWHKKLAEAGAMPNSMEICQCPEVI
jgi:hypothetical protein